MALTRRCYASTNRKFVKYLFRNRRNLPRKVAKNRRSAYRNHNRFASELTLTNFNSKPYRQMERYFGKSNGFESSSSPIDLDVLTLIGEEHRKLSIDYKKRIIEKLEEIKQQDKGTRDKKTLSIALKMLLRRGKLEAFRGHRDPRKLYKHETI